MKKYKVNIYYDRMLSAYFYTDEKPNRKMFNFLVLTYISPKVKK